MEISALCTVFLPQEITKKRFPNIHVRWMAYIMPILFEDCLIPEVGCLFFLNCILLNKDDSYKVLLMTLILHLC